MQSASSDLERPSRVRRLGPVALGAVVLALVAGGAAPARHGSFAPVVEHRLVVGTLGAAERRKLATSAWAGGVFTTSTGESVRVLVDEAYPDPEAVGQQWADFFASLLHGSELGLLTAYVVSEDEMPLLCGSDAVACYGSNQLAFVGQAYYGVPPEEAARHEYGHHVAFNRSNAPWQAVDTGPKRWASYLNICQRTQLGTAYPGNEHDHYQQNPGEAWAETYRVLNDLKAGATSFSWGLVDGSFYPDSAALQAAEQDVVSPWTGSPVTQSFRSRFVGGGKKVWKATVTTPLDGDFAVALSMPHGALDDLTIFTPDGRTVLAKGLWSSATQKKVTATVCGQRSVLLRVTAKGVLGRFAVQVTHD